MDQQKRRSREIDGTIQSPSKQRTQFSLTTQQQNHGGIDSDTEETIDNFLREIHKNGGGAITGSMERKARSILIRLLDPEQESYHEEQAQQLMSAITEYIQLHSRCRS